MRWPRGAVRSPAKWKRCPGRRNEKRRPPVWRPRSRPRQNSPRRRRPLGQVEEWLAEIARSASGRTIRRLLVAAKAARKARRRGGGDCRGLALSVGSDPRRPRPLSRAARGRARGTIRAGDRGRDARRAHRARDADAMRVLRRAKAEAALLIALADIGGVWPVERVTRALTDFADAALGAAVRYLLRGAAARGKLKLRDPAEPEQGQRLRRARDGQDGRARAQYSSDIDLIVLYERAAALAPGAEPARAVRPPHARSGEADAGAHRRRLRVPHRSAAAPRPGLDPDRDLDRCRARTTTRASGRTGSAPR